jgi:Ras-related GTP-binding protein C/D
MVHDDNDDKHEDEEEDGDFDIDNNELHHQQHIVSEEEEEGEEEEEEEDPRFHTLPGILFLGPRRSGKTSIQRVVFQKMSPHETLFRLEATQTIERTIVDHTSLCRFIIWDFPGDYYGGGGGSGYSTVTSSHSRPQQQQHYAPSWFRHHDTNNETTDSSSSALMNYRDYDASSSSAAVDHPNMDAQQHQQSLLQNSDDVAIFSTSTALVFVMDAQDEPYDHVLQHFISTVSRAVAINPNIAVEVFINKVDGELFLSDEAKYECRRDIMQQVSDELIDAQLDASVNYHLVSIYDHSIFEALSRVVQKVIPQYQPTLENLLNTLVGSCAMEKAYLFDVASKLYISTDSSPVDMQTVELCSDMIDVVLDVSGIYGTHHSTANAASTTTKKKKIKERKKQEGTSLSAAPIQDTAGASSSSSNEAYYYNTTKIDEEDFDDEQEEEAEETLECSAFDDQSSSVIRLSNGMILYLREVDSMLALVCLIRSENFRKKSLINYNIGCLKKSLKQLVEVQK